MGMSSSQARLLSLTSRMHDIELKAQRLQASKLLLANESDAVYDAYMVARDARKIQYKTLSSNGGVTFKDANMNIMQNGSIPGYSGEKSNRILFLQDQNGKILVTPQVADAFGLESDAVNMGMDEYIVAQVPEAEKSTRNVLDHYELVENRDKINSVTPIATAQTKEYKYKMNVGSAVDTVEGGNVVKHFRSFTDQITPTTSGTPISSQADLAALSGKSGTFYLTQDITLNSWTGLTNFQGTLNGNGHTIKINGSNGLCASASGATIKNLMIDANIDAASGSNKAGFCGQATGVTIENCVLVGNINNLGSHSAGFIGDGYGTVNKCQADVNLTANSICVGVVFGHGQSGDCYATNLKVSGSVNTSSSQGWSGGVVGHSSTSPYKTYIQDVMSFVNIQSPRGSNGYLIGYVDNPANYVVERVVYNDDGSHNLCGNDTSFEEAYAGQLIKAYSDPSIDYDSANPTYKGAFYSNILAALYKANGNNPDGIDQYTTPIDHTGAEDPNGLDKIQRYIKNLFESTDDEETLALKIANINRHVYKYLNNSTIAGEDADINERFMAALKSDIDNSLMHRTSTLGAFQEYFYESTSVPNLTSGTTGQWTPNPYLEKGNYNIPNKRTIADTIYYLLKKTEDSSDDIDKSTLRAWFDQYNSSNADDMVSLANINDVVASKNIAHILAITDWFQSHPGQKYQTNANYDKDYYTITMNSSYIDPEIPENNIVSYGDDLVPRYREELFWDTSDANPLGKKIANAMAMWVIAQRGIEVVDSTLAASSQYLNNIITTGQAVFTSFDPQNYEAIKTEIADKINEDPDYVRKMSENQYNKLMGIENTSVATETCVQEVEDTKNVKQLEAKYESDMAKINAKDRRYDTELSVCENEREAIKSEMETLKTVARDNVDRTFKLFS